MNLSADGRLRLAARVAFAVGVGAFVGEAGAQESAAQEVAQADTATKAATEESKGPATSQGPAVKLGGVQVTGSRIKSPNLTSTSPITVVGAAEFKAQGTTRVEDLVNNLPQAYADQGGNINNGADGTATVNLRNLGASRTLVLIDGKRSAPGTPGNPNTDLNFIPAQLVSSVEVLTGGASSVYGSDAVAGVVNFVLKKDFEGVRIDYQRAGYLHENDQTAYRSYLSNAGFPLPNKQKFDGGSNSLSLLFGINTGDGKGNATLYASYLQVDPIRQDARDFGACQLSADSDDTFACGGSATSFPGRFRIGPPGTPRRDITVDQTTGEFRPFRAAPGAGSDLYNFAPLNYYQRNVERYSLGGIAHYKVNDAFDAYTQVMFTDDRTTTLAAPSGAFGNAATISCDSPLLTAGQRAELCTSRGLTATQRQNITINRRNVEGGPRTTDFDRYQFRIVSGLRGEFLKNWSYDASVQYGQAAYQNIQAGYFSNSRLANALNVVTVNGVAQCANGGVDGCVPYNIYGRGTVTADQLAYLNISSLASGSTTQHLATGSITGALGDYGLRSPFATDGVGIAFGGEYRRESARFDSDETSRSGDLGGGGGAAPAIDGGFTVRELFAELNVPLIQDKPLIKSLGVEAGYRRSNYTNVVSTDTYKIAGEYAPTDDIRFRGGFNRAVRAPSIGDVVDPVTIFLGGSTDPCSGPIGPNGVVSGGATRAQCANDPLIAARPDLYGNIDFDPAGQYNAQAGVDGQLVSESADTYTAGFVFTPTFVKNFSLSLDYFDIQVNDRIGRRGADNILNLCYQQGQFCNFINRNPIEGGNFGSLFGNDAGFTVDQITNSGFLVAKGIDVAANYRFRLSQLGFSSAAGSVVLDLVGTRSLKQDIRIIENDPSTQTSCNGQFGPVVCGTPNPLWATSSVQPTRPRSTGSRRC